MRPIPRPLKSHYSRSKFTGETWKSEIESICQVKINFEFIPVEHSFAAKDTTSQSSLEDPVKWVILNSLGFVVTYWRAIELVDKQMRQARKEQGQNILSIPAHYREFKILSNLLGLKF